MIDSLRNTLRHSNTSERTLAYLSLGIAYVQANPVMSINYVDSAYRSASAAGDSLNMVKAARIKGQILLKIDMLDSSIHVLHAALLIAQRIKAEADYNRILNALALGYTWQARYDEALKYNFQSLEIREASGNKEDISITLNNIALVYFKLMDPDKALQYYNRSLLLKKEANVSYDLDRLYINIGLCYNLLENYKKGLENINEGLTICGGNCDKVIQLEGKLGLAIALQGTGKFQVAENYFNQAGAIAKELGNTRFQLEVLKNLAQLNMKTHHEDIAENQLKEAEEMAMGTVFNQILIDIYHEFSFLYTQKKDFEKATNYANKYIVLKDSIYSQNLLKNLTTIQNNYEQRANIKTIADKDAVLALKEETLKRQESEAIFYIVVSALVFTLSVLMYLLFRLTQRANNLLEHRVEQRTHELNDSNEALAKVNGELDNFIYKTSHDIRGPLASLKGICNVAIMDVSDEAALAYLQKLDFTAEKLNRILTRLLIINQINHAVLASNVIIFEELLEDILFLERKKGVPRRLKIFYEIEKGFVLKSDKEMLRIVLENLIDNGIKFYSESDRVDPFVKIFVYAVEGQVVIKVIDNGVGINAETKEKIFQMFVRASERSETGGIGLYLARLATGRLEGKIEFRTTPEKYTEFSIKLPMDLAPILEDRYEQDRIREFEKIKITEKQSRFSLR